MVALKDEPDVLIAQVASLVLVQFVDRLIEEVILARPGAVMHADQMQQRGLSGAGRSRDGDKFAFFDFSVDAPQDEGLSNAMGVELLDVSEFDHRYLLVPCGAGWQPAVRIVIGPVEGATTPRAAGFLSTSVR